MTRACVKRVLALRSGRARVAGVDRAVDNRAC